MNYHDLLARLGVTNAHPGGYTATQAWMDKISLSETDRVLDVGCGNGATACAVAERWGCSVTAIDLRPKMVENTRRRSQRMGVEVTSMKASAESLPFEAQTFDLIVCESVLVFVNIRRALREFHRVLRATGQVIDVEMMPLQPVTEVWREQVRALYGATNVPDLVSWKQLYRSSGFFPEVIRSGSLYSVSMSEEQTDEATADRDALRDPRILALIEANGRWIESNKHTMGYGIFMLTKEISSS